MAKLWYGRERSLDEPSMKSVEHEDIVNLSTNASNDDIAFML